MATKAKGSMLKEQITFDFFKTMEIVKPIKQRKIKVIDKKPTKEKTKKIIFRKAKHNIKPNHRKLNRKVRKIF